MREESGLNASRGDQIIVVLITEDVAMMDIVLLAGYLNICSRENKSPAANGVQTMEANTRLRIGKWNHWPTGKRVQIHVGAHQIKTYDTICGSRHRCVSNNPGA